LCGIQGLHLDPTDVMTGQAGRVQQALAALALIIALRRQTTRGHRGEDHRGHRPDLPPERHSTISHSP
jgi:hypothetical protein